MQAAKETMDQSKPGIKNPFECSPLAHDKNEQLYVDLVSLAVVAMPSTTSAMDTAHADSQTYFPLHTGSSKRNYSRQEFKNLGSTIARDLDDTTEIERRLSLAQMTFKKFRKLRCNQRIRADLLFAS